MNKLPTIKVSGKEYVEVKERVKYFNDIYPKGSIQTEVVTGNSNMVTFKATVIPDIDVPTRFFTGHSFGTVDEVKAFEKLESTATGRALAFLGIGIIDSIASADEMVKLNSKATKYPSQQRERIKPTQSDYEDIKSEPNSFELKAGKTKSGKDWMAADEKNGLMGFWLQQPMYDEIERLQQKR